jgi:23S rRNA pseudouridine1911/1915/1917 synthase
MTRDGETLKPGNAGIAPEGNRFGFTIEAHDAGARLDKWLSDRIESLTRTRIKALIEGGALSRGGEVFTDPSWKLREGEDFALIVPPPEDPAPIAQAIPLDVVYEDDDIIVVNKPAGLVVHPAAGNWSGTLVNALIHHCGTSLSGIGGVARPGIVHRIDKDTSGLLVVAKNDAAHQGLTKAFSNHDIERVYEAIAVGAPRPGVGTIDAPLARAKTDRKKMAVVDYDDDEDEDDMTSPRGARHAITHYKVLESFGRTRAKLSGDALASLIECRLETGRTHQIRAHLASIGHPLIGDQTYGRGPGLSGLKPGDDAADNAITAIRAFRRQALHARVLGFSHPVSGETLRFERAAPADFLKLLAALRAL